MGEWEKQRATRCDSSSPQFLLPAAAASAAARSASLPPDLPRTHALLTLHPFTQGLEGDNTFLSMLGVPGEAKQKGHAGEIDVHSWSWSALNPGSGSVPGKLVGGDLKVLKQIDKVRTRMSERRVVQSSMHASCRNTLRATGRRPAAAGHVSECSLH